MPWTPQFPSPDTSSPDDAVPASTDPVLVTIGDIGVTRNWVVTPSGTASLPGSSWAVRDRTRDSKRYAWWVFVGAILLFPIGLLFFLVGQKENRTGTVEITMTNGTLTHVTEITIRSSAEDLRLIKNVNFARLLTRVGIVLLGSVGLFVSMAILQAMPGFAKEASCRDCDLIVAEADLPEGYHYDVDSPSRDASGTAKSIVLKNCQHGAGYRSEPSGTERQFAVFLDSHDEFGAADENVVRFATRKRAHRFAGAFRPLLRQGPQCDEVTLDDGGGRTIPYYGIQHVDIGGVGDERGAIVWVDRDTGEPRSFFAVVRTGRVVIILEAEANDQVDQVRFAQLAADAARTAHRAA